MKIDRVTADDGVMIELETVAECGILSWLVSRFGGAPVTLIFDTTNHVNNKDPLPRMWIYEASKPKEANAK